MRRRTAAALEGFPCSRYSCLCRRPEPAHLSISITVDYVIVDHADRLHVCVDDRRSNKAETAALEFAAERVRFGGRCGNLTRRIPPILPRRAINELPAIGVEAQEPSIHSILTLGALFVLERLAALERAAALGPEPLHVLRVKHTLPKFEAPCLIWRKAGVLDRRPIHVERLALR